LDWVESFIARAHGRRWGAAGLVAGIHVEGTLADMIFHADGTRTTSSSFSSVSFDPRGAVTGSSSQTGTQSAKAERVRSS
jgi:hypothetical protein